MTEHEIEGKLIDKMVGILIVDGPLALSTLQDDLGIRATEAEAKAGKASWQYIPGILYLIERGRASGLELTLDKSGRLCYNGT
jgi:hypothetical protein